MRTAIIHEGEVAVFSAQGEFELHVSWCYVLVCCRDLHNQLECGRWRLVSCGIGMVWGSVMETLGLDLTMAATHLQC